MWYYERAGDDDERLPIREPPSDADIDFFSSTELRLVMLGGGGGAPAEVQGRKHILCGCLRLGSSCRSPPSKAQ